MPGAAQPASMQKDTEPHLYSPVSVFLLVAAGLVRRMDDDFFNKYMKNLRGICFKLSIAFSQYQES